MSHLENILNGLRVAVEQERALVDAATFAGCNRQIQLARRQVEMFLEDAEREIERERVS